MRGDASRRIAGLATLESAGPDELSFFTHPRYEAAARASRAAAILLRRGLDLPGRDLLWVDHPALALARLLELFHPRHRPAPGVHATAVLATDAEVARSAHVGAYVVVGAGSRVGAGSVLHPHVVVGERCRIGEGAVLHPHVVLYDGVEIGAGVVVHAGSVLGSDGFGYASVAGVHHKIPQVGNVQVGQDVEIGALVAIDRALLGSTSIGDGSKIDNLVQVGHNVEVGRACVLCGQAGIAGSARLGNGVVLAGQAGVSGHLTVGDGVQVAAKSAVLGEVAPGRVVAGIPAVEIATWRRSQATWRRLGGLLRRLRAIERRLGIKGSGGEESDERDS